MIIEKIIVNKRIVQECRTHSIPDICVRMICVYIDVVSFFACDNLGCTNHELGQEEDAGHQIKAKRVSCLYKSYGLCSNSFSRIKKVLIGTLIDLWTNNNVRSVLMCFPLYSIHWCCVCALLCAFVPGQICR